MIKNCNKKICFIFNEPILDSVPCLLSFITLLSKNNVTIDIFCLENKSCVLPNFLALDNISLYSLKSDFNKGGKILGSQTINRLYHVFRFMLFIITKINLKKYDYLVGVEQDGIIVSWILSKLGISTKKFIYFSLELYLSSEISKSILETLWKNLEKKANQAAEFTIIQDLERAKLIAEDNHLNIESIYQLPNSPLGEAKYEKTFFLYEHLKINKEKTLLLHAGAIADWAYTQELSQAANQLSAEYVTVFQSRYDLRGDEYLEKVKANVNQEKVIFSLVPFAYDDLDQVYSSADIGLAFYNTKMLGTNCQTIGLSSGKIARYLFHGIPVIINNETSLVNLINEYRCGVIINHWDELNNACNLIKDNYLDYSKNACDCFNQVLAVEKHFRILWSEAFK